MAINLINIKSGEKVSLTREPQIAAYINSSDMNPNGRVQDFGWRLSPEDVKRMEMIRKDATIMQSLSAQQGIPVADLNTGHLLAYIVHQDRVVATLADDHSDLQDKIEAEYEAKVREVKARVRNPKPVTAPKAIKK